MADKISGFGRVGLDVGQARGRAVSRPDKAGEGGASARARQAGDAVEITDAAARLKAAEARLADVPDVDRGRVEALRQRIESGEYRPDASRIAQKLLRLERELA